MISSILGFAFETIDSNVDLPTLGKPTKPTSANNLSSKVTSSSSPGSPFSLKSGAGLRGVAKRELPRPPRPLVQR